MITSIEYNRSARRWELRGEIGELLDDFPAGPNGRHAALLAQLEIEAPDALAIAIQAEENHPGLNGRAIRGIQLLAAGNVTEHPNYSAEWFVTNENHIRHGVTGHGRWTCSCQDWINGTSGVRNSAPDIRQKPGRPYHTVCKHIAAVMIMLRLQEWPPGCPECGKTTHIKRQQNDGSGLPFFSCSNFPYCPGRAEFQPHPADIAHEKNGRDALFASLERAKQAGLIDTTAGAQRRARHRRLENARMEAIR
jgi:hypothetical protein